ncbi:sulfotransferase family protein [Actibacterium lipolyticum]|nr:sulfotransferase [Actibacterium lipolyticum]
MNIAMTQPGTDTLPQPVFIIALPKSYTSVLSGMLGQHPSLLSVPELNLFVGDTVMDWANQPASFIFCDGLLRTTAQLLFGAQTAMTVSQSLEWLQERADWKVKDVFDVLREHAAPSIVIDQSPIYTQRPDFTQRVLQAYPNARFIHLTRNPTAWVASMAKWGPQGEEILRMYTQAEVGLDQVPSPIELWHAVHTGVEAFLDPLDDKQVLRVMGEDVVTQPKEILRTICEWLDLPSEDGVISEMLHPERSIFAGWGPPGARGGNNPDYLTAPQLRTRNDRDKLLKIDRSAMPVSDAISEYAEKIGYS